MLPGMVPTIDESTEINAMRTDIETYIKESRANFVTGTWNFDSDWDKLCFPAGRPGRLPLRGDQAGPV